MEVKLVAVEILNHEKSLVRTEVFLPIRLMPASSMRQRWRWIFITARPSLSGGQRMVFGMKSFQISRRQILTSP